LQFVKKYVDSPLGRKLVDSPFCPCLARHLEAEIAKPLMILPQVPYSNPCVVKISNVKLYPPKLHTDSENMQQPKQKTLRL